MAKTKMVIMCFLVASAGVVDAQTESTTIEGLYKQDGVPIGLSIKQLEDGNYLFQKVFLKSNGELVPFEWQSAYVVTPKSNHYLFYWHTGRFEDIPDSNKIIVFRLQYRNDRFTGTYFSRRPGATKEVESSLSDNEIPIIRIESTPST